MSKNIKIISFDLDDTLWPITEVINRAQAAYAHWFIDNYPDLHAQGLWSRLSAKESDVKKMPGGHCLTHVRKKSLILLLLEAGVGEVEAGEAAEDAFEAFYRERINVRPFEGVELLLENLGARYQLVSLTNGNADVEQTALKNCFHLNLNPQRVGARKPDKLMFSSVCEHFNVTPKQVLHIGDHYQEDVLGAKAVGFQALWVLHKSERENLCPERRAQITQWIQVHEREPLAPFVDSIESLSLCLNKLLMPQS